MLKRFVQPLNAAVPIRITLFGIVIVSRLVHFENAAEPINRVLSLISNEVIDVSVISTRRR